MQEYDQRRASGESHRSIQAAFEERGIHWRTLMNYRTKAKKTTVQEPATTEEVVEVEQEETDTDTDTGRDVHYDAVNEFLALPEGYAKVIQPMQPYSEAEEWALDKSMELYGFLGAIVRDQYGRILDGNQRQRLGRLRGLKVPHTTTFIRDDAHAIDIARTLNTVRRHYTKEQREELAPLMRDQGYTYEAIAEALGVGKATVYRDVMGVLRVRTEQSVVTDTPPPITHDEIVPNETISPENHETIVPNETIEAQTHDKIVPNETIALVRPEPSQPVPRVKRKGGGTYPAKRSNGTKVTTSAADRQLAGVINLLMNHAPQWDEQHWQRFLDVVQSLRGSQAPTPATE